MLWLWLYVSVSTGPYHATSVVAPAPRAANAAVPRMLAGRNLLSRDPISSPYRDYSMVLFRHLWRWVWDVGVRPRRVRPFLPYPGSGRGRPASVRSSPTLAVRMTHTLPTIIACASGILPFPVPLPTYLIRSTALPLAPRSFTLRSVRSPAALPLHYCTVMVMVMVIHLGLNRSPPRYLISSPGSVRLAPPCLNCRCGRTFSRPAPLAGFTRLRYGIVAPPVWRCGRWPGLAHTIYG